VRAQAAEQQCAMLEEEKVILENKFADSASGRLEKTGASEDKLLAAERERDAALQARDFLERRQNHIEAESSKLQQSIDTKQQVLLTRRGMKSCFTAASMHVLSHVHAPLHVRTNTFVYSTCANAGGRPGLGGAYRSSGHHPSFAAASVRAVRREK